MIDLLSENGAEVQVNLGQCKSLLEQASWNLKILDPELGEQELVKSVAAEQAKLVALIAENNQRQ